MLKISASNFGPIIEGTVELKPLTVFVGPNNAGKSYMAMLIYSLFKAMPRGAGIAPYFRDFGRDFTSIASRRLFSPYQLGLEDEITREQQDEFLTWARELPNSSSKEHRRILISELPQFFKDLTRRAIDQSAEDFADALERELQRCFGATISDLNCTFEPSQPFKIRINRQQPPWEVGIASSNGAIELESGEFDLSDVHVEGVERFTKYLRKPDGHGPRARARILPDHFMFDFLSNNLAQIMGKIYNEANRRTYYLPAARSGILQGHKAIASVMVAGSPLVGIDRLEIPRLTGVIADFITILLMFERRQEGPLAQIARFLETDLMQGSISLEADKLEYPEIYYQTSAARFQLHRTSSMVSELAPVILLLKHVVEGGDFLIIEEPESHLHPGNQQRLAQAIAMLIRAGVRILITTHSDYFLGQLTNFTRLGGLDEKVRNEFGYGANVYLNADEIGAYWFDHTPDVGGTKVTELPITVEDGIPEDSFTDFVEKLYNESVELHDLTSNRR